MNKFQKEIRKTIRIPLIGQTFHRPSGTTGYLTDTAVDQRFINCLFQKRTNSISGQSTTLCFKRPGLSTLTAIAASGSFLGGVFVNDPLSASTNRVNIFADSLNLYIYENTTLKVTIAMTDASLQSQVVPIVFPSNEYGVAFRVLDGSTIRSYVYNISTDTATEITDIDYPTSTVGSFVQKNGYLYIARQNGDIHNSDLNAPTSWSSTSFITTRKRTACIGLVEHRGKIIAMGQDYIDVFEDVGNPTGSPLRRIDELCIDGIGTTRYTTFCSYNDEIYFVTPKREKQQQSAIWKINGFKLEPIIIPELKNLLQSEDTAITLLGVYDLFGHSYLIFTADNDPLYMYNLDLHLLTEWDWGVSLSGNIIYLTAGTLANLDVYHGTGYRTLDCNGSTYTDSGSAYTQTIQTTLIDLGTEKRKRLHKLSLIGLDSQAAATTNISWSDDDYQTFTTARAVDMNNQRTYLSNLGAFRRRAFKITNATNTPCTIEALEFEYSELSS